MSKLISRRLALGVLTLLLVSLVVFAAVLALPGDAATAILGRDATPERIAALRDQLHLHDSVVAQYGKWLGGLLTGDLGTSAATQQPVSDLLGSRIVHSAVLVMVAAVIAIPLAIALGVVMAVKRDRPADHVLSTATLILAALPEFVIALALVLVFATGVFRWLPAVSLMAPGTGPLSRPEVLVLPTATLVLAVVPYISRIMRASMVEILESEYVAMARLKGLSERRVVWRHAVPNAIGPALQVTALQLAWMAGGVVLVEFVFSYQGVGALLVDSVANRDMPVVQPLAMFAAGIYIVVNLLADIATILVTPKLRTATR
jgi:peptide/nickel transport system permease protein